MSTPSNQTEAVWPLRDCNGAIDEDLFCLSCGYNLRGLSGDPVRCPECGESNDLGSLRIPATAIRTALRDMETSPTWCVACMVACTTLVPLLVVVAKATLVPLIFMVSSVCGWLVAVREMRRDYEGRPGWKSILVRHHVATALILTVVLLPLGLKIYFETRRRIDVMQRDKAVRIARETIRKAMRRKPGRQGR